MKKFFVFFVVAICFATVSFAGVRIKPDKPTPTQIATSISNMQEYNNQIKDPDWIFPGQVIIFIHQDEFISLIKVEPGDCLWTIIRDKLAGAIAVHGPIVDYFPQKKQAGVDDPIPTEKDEADDVPVMKENPWLILGLILLLLALILGILYYKRKQAQGKYSENPAKEGKPFVSNGVRPEDSGDHFRKLAKVEYPKAEANIRIKDQKPGFLSTPNGKSAAVEFVDGTVKDLQFRNQPGFSGMVSIDGGKTFEEEFFFEQCGNPVRRRKSIPKYSGLIFSENPIDFADEPVASEESKPSTLETVPIVEKSVVGSDDRDVMQVSADHAGVAEEFLATQKAHKVTMMFTKSPDGTVKLESVFETKNSPAKKNKQE